jgi:hypothetical protein
MKTKTDFRSSIAFLRLALRLEVTCLSADSEFQQVVLAACHQTADPDREVATEEPLPQVRTTLAAIWQSATGEKFRKRRV